MACIHRIAHLVDYPFLALIDYLLSDDEKKKLMSKLSKNLVGEARTEVMGSFADDGEIKTAVELLEPNGGPATRDIEKWAQAMFDNFDAEDFQIIANAMHVFLQERRKEFADAGDDEMIRHVDEAREELDNCVRSKVVAEGIGNIKLAEELGKY